MDEYIKNNIKRHAETIDNRSDKYYSWLKGLITIASGLIAILISLKKEVSKTHFEHLLFIATIGLLSSGIVFGSIVLFQEVSVLDQSARVLHNHIKGQLSGNQNDQISWVKPHWIYKICSWVSVLSFLVALVSLIVYAYYMDLP